MARPDERYIQNNEKGYRLYVDDAPYENQLGVGSRKPAFTQNDDVYQQSQFKKPYLEDDYEEMEYYSDAFPGFSNDWDFDTPFETGENNLDPLSGSNPWHVVCFCDTAGICYGDGGFQCEPIRCNWPVTSIEVISAPPGCSVKISGGQACAKCTKGEKGTISFKINMRAKFKHNGQTVVVNCSHYSQMSSCFDIIGPCNDSEMEYDYASSIETIARNASGTVAISDPNLNSSSAYSWSVSGTGFTLDEAITTGLTNTLNADGTACGSAEITVTGCGGNTTTGYVRCTTGIWTAYSVICGSDGGTCNTSSCSVVEGKIERLLCEQCMCSDQCYDCSAYFQEALANCPPHSGAQDFCEEWAPGVCGPCQGTPPGTGRLGLRRVSEREWVCS